MVCFDSTQNEHNTCDCPILKNLGFKIEKQTPYDTPREAACWGLYAGHDY